jgi:hypothetical protein
MVINYFYVVGVTFFPNKADSPLLVDPNAMLSLSLAA